MEYPKVTCRECGQEDEACYMEPTRTEMVEQELCFTCHFWVEKVAWAQAGDTHPSGSPCVRLDHRHYVAHPFEEGPRSGFRGFGGYTFTFQMLDGREVVSNNVWHQGHIPPHFHDRLPDNAKGEV